MRREPAEFLNPGVTATAPPEAWRMALDAEGPVYCMQVNDLLPEVLAGSPVGQAAA